MRLAVAGQIGRSAVTFAAVGTFVTVAAVTVVVAASGRGRRRRRLAAHAAVTRFVHHIDYAYKLSVTISLNKFRELNQYLRQIASASK